MLKGVTKCRNVVVWGRDAKKMALYKKDVEKMGFKVTCAKDAAQVGASCNLIVTATCATSPILMSKHVKAGTHITAVGADGIGKQEVDHKVLARAKLVVADSLAQCCAFGEISHGLKAGVIKQKNVLELGQVIRDKKGRAANDNTSITFADLTGVAV